MAAALFCGMGGATRGMKAAGLNVVKSYDWSKQEVEAHLWLEPDIPCEQRDVRTIDPEELRGLFVWASPSCKPYSLANRTPKRGKLHPEYYSLAYLASQCRYAAVTVIENVMHLLHGQEGKEEVAELRGACTALGITYQVLTPRSSEFGIPQHRQRCIIVLGAPLVSLSRGVAVEATYSVLATENVGHYMYDIKTRKTIRPARSVEERARLQGLPVPPFKGKVRDRLIGNAVPPLLAEAVCLAVLSSMACEVAA